MRKGVGSGEGGGGGASGQQQAEGRGLVAVDDGASAEFSNQEGAGRALHAASGGTLLGLSCGRASAPYAPFVPFAHTTLKPTLTWILVPLSLKEAFSILGASAMQILGQGTNCTGSTPWLRARGVHCTMVQANCGWRHSSPAAQVVALAQGL